MSQEIQHYFTIFADDFGVFDTHTYDWFLHPVVTPTAIKEMRLSYQLPKTIPTYNALFDRVNKVTSDYLTVNFAGRHTGRQFLLALQDEMQGKTPLDYNNKVLIRILHRLRFDVSDFIRYYHFAQTSLIQEQKNFHSERLTILPSTLIYFQDDVIRIDALAQRQIFAFLNEKTAER
ncbi:MAG: dithiol-disulfide isomerase [Lactococcus sp.]|nr:dithiol-disulfide isomerase [Lactococcus sp.]